eukprot:TRINITY_DN23857_c0_g1_i2.p1 TRINITY_DN23857_c0_g1~~TRINITY_DN23857_c0_g1_i2.p1  ORF type:complete len:697 (+),score=196.10 TRINITY_DN23857_c0_g1_i2:113-2092(+)
MLLIPETSLQAAAGLLVSEGYSLWPASRFCRPISWEAPDSQQNDPSVSKQLAGVWSLVQREEPLGTIIEEYIEGDGPLRLQSPGGLFVELRIPEGETSKFPETTHREASFAGRCLATEKDGFVHCVQLRGVDFQPPTVDIPNFQVTLSEASIEVVGQDRSNEEEYRELWARVGAANVAQEVVALELQSESPETKPRHGVWIFSGKRFARLLAPLRGTGLIASTCCESLGQLQKLHGSRVNLELQEQYEACFGIVEEPGFLRTRKRSGQPDKDDTVFFNALDETTGKVAVGQDRIVHTLASGQKQTWKILEWNFNPFAPPPGKDGRDNSPAPSQATSIAPDSDEEDRIVGEEDDPPTSPAEDGAREDVSTKTAPARKDAADAEDQSHRPFSKKENTEKRASGERKKGKKQKDEDGLLRARDITEKTGEDEGEEKTKTKSRDKQRNKQKEPEKDNDREHKGRKHKKDKKDRKDKKDGKGKKDKKHKQLEEGDDAVEEEKAPREEEENGGIEDEQADEDLPAKQCSDVSEAPPSPVEKRKKKRKDKKSKKDLVTQEEDDEEERRQDKFDDEQKRAEAEEEDDGEETPAKLASDVSGAQASPKGKRQKRHKDAKEKTAKPERKAKLTKRRKTCTDSPVASQSPSPEKCRSQSRSRERKKHKQK